MTRKKFVKLMMWKGYSRNEVNRLASSVVKCGTSYLEVYLVALVVLWLAKNLREANAILCKELRKFWLGLTETVRKVQELSAQVKAVEAYKAGMDAYDERHGVTSQE